MISSPRTLIKERPSRISLALTFESFLSKITCKRVRNFKEKAIYSQNQVDLQAHFRVLVADNDGHGDSPAIKKEWLLHLPLAAATALLIDSIV